MCELFLLQIHLKKELNVYRKAIKSKKDYHLLKLFKFMAFQDKENAQKRITLSDLIRFFRLNKLLVEPDRLQEIFFERIVGKGNVFDYSKLHKLVTKENRESIVHNPCTQVSGFRQDVRRNKEHNHDFNEKAIASLTAPKEVFARKDMMLLEEKD